MWTVLLLVAPMSCLRHPLAMPWSQGQGTVAKVALSGLPFFWGAIRAGKKSFGQGGGGGLMQPKTGVGVRTRAHVTEALFALKTSLHWLEMGFKAARAEFFFDKSFPHRRVMGII